ncbi:SixA phosphatase family protein [Neptunomonas marina]|uniref:Histidine phosphatase family protein n=1 Tax=Neptunomonas marina TaxID=1815562 RepID=A0A437Q660_9GAMM|nr:histidine phosphatase family protein [Neptunomonas marina]RVU29982.1 histidine phosphatase family protein [Neptunomonas marina]
MRLLTLVRHAKSSWKDPDLTDYERPLNKRGRRDLPHAAQRCKAQLPPPDIIIASGAVRTWITATAIHQHFGLAVPLIEDDSLYLASAEAMAALLMGQSDHHVMLVGHNPGLTELVYALSGEALDKFPTSAILHLHLNLDDWADLHLDCGIISHFDYPKLHK